MTKFDNWFDKVLNLVVLFGASMLTVPISMMMFTYESTVIFEDAYTVMPIFAVTSTFFGYCIQSLYSKITGKRASKDGFSDYGAGVISGFNLGNAIVPIIVFVILAILLFFPIDTYFENMYLADRMSYYNPVYGIFASVLFCVASILGCVIWFYPIERLANMTILVIAGVLFYAEMFFTTLLAAPLFSMGLNVLNQSSVTSIIGPPFIIFTVCLLIVFNQNNLQRKFQGSVVSVVTPSARMYNLFLVFIILLMLVLMVLVVYVLLSGLYIILYAIGFIALYNMFYGRKESNTQSIEAEYFGSEHAGNRFQRDIMSTENQYVLAIFFLLIITAAALLILSKTGYLRKLVERVREWFRDFIHSFLVGRDIFKNAGDKSFSEEIYNYKDEKKQLQNASINDFNDLANQTETYKMFMMRLSRLKDYNEQLCFAYAVLLKMYKRININLKISDTPRQIEDKVRRSVSEVEIKKITADFERIRYAEEEVSDSEASAILTNICEAVKRYMY